MTLAKCLHHSCRRRVYSSGCTNGARCLSSGGRQSTNGGHVNSRGGVLSAVLSETAKQSSCGTLTSTAEAPTDAYRTRTARQSYSICSKWKCRGE